MVCSFCFNIAEEKIIFFKSTMKKILLSTFAALALTMGQAQLPANTICPDFTGTDLEGNTWNLYSLLDEGKTVIIEVSAAWCGPCWGYHSSNILKNFHNQYGPSGTGEAMVLFIEGEAANTGAQLTGTDGGTNATYTQGNWVNGTPFPIIDDASIAELLEISSFPTFFMVCPDRVISYADGFYVNQEGTAISYPLLTDWEDMMNESECALASNTIDPRFLQLNGDGANCTDQSAKVSVLMQNKGTEPLTSATITITGAGSPIVYDWSGNLATYEATNIEINGIEADPAATVTVSVTSSDNVPANSTGEIEVYSW